MLTSSCKKEGDDNTNTNNNNNNPSPITVTDIDGNVYSTITIGTQVWMAENLKTTKYRDGSAIPNVTSDSVWGTLSAGAYCNYNDDATNSTTYGRLYNWYAVNDTRMIAPAGWHVPKDAEWSTLVNYLIANGYNFDGTTTGNSIAKSLASTTLWSGSANAGAVGNTDYPSYRNKTGFTALPGGDRYVNGSSFSGLGSFGYWWSSTASAPGVAWSRYMGYSASGVFRIGYVKEVGLSVRCLRN